MDTITKDIDETALEENIENAGGKGVVDKAKLVMDEATGVGYELTGVGRMIIEATGAGGDYEKDISAVSEATNE